MLYMLQPRTFEKRSTCYCVHFKRNLTLDSQAPSRLVLMIHVLLTPRLDPTWHQRWCPVYRYVSSINIPVHCARGNSRKHASAVNAQVQDRGPGVNHLVQQHKGSNQSH